MSETPEPIAPDERPGDAANQEVEELIDEIEALVEQIKDPDHRTPPDETRT